GKPTGSQDNENIHFCDCFPGDIRGWFWRSRALSMELAHADNLWPAHDFILAGIGTIELGLDIIRRAARLARSSNAPPSQNPRTLGSDEPGRAGKISRRHATPLQRLRAAGRRIESLTDTAGKQSGCAVKSQPHHYCCATRRLFVTEKMPGTLFARTPAKFLSASLSTTPSRVTCPFFTMIRIGFTTGISYFCSAGYPYIAINSLRRRPSSIGETGSTSI